MIEEVAGKIFHNQLIIRPQGNQLTAHMPPIVWSAFSDREIPTELCVSLPSFSCMQMQCMSEFYPNLNLHTSKPTLSPRVVATGGHAGHRVWLVVARCRQATATCIGISGGWAGPPLPTSRPAHHSSSLTAGETDLEGPPPASGTRTHRPQPPQNGPRRPAVPFGHFYNPLRPAESSWAVRAAVPSHNPPVCGCPLRPRTAHNGGHGHEAAAGPPQPTATPPLWSSAASGEPATAHRSEAAEECAALQPRARPEVEQQ